MRRWGALASGCALALAVLASTAEAQRAETQPRTGTDVQEPATPHPHGLTLTGCVYQAADDPTVFALRTDRGSGDDSPGTPADRGTRDEPAPVGTSGATTGGWYRLAPGAPEDLSHYIGQRVEVHALAMPARHDRSAGAVVHRIDPERLTVTTTDLQPAPQLAISSIVPARGSCEAAAR